MTVTNTRRAWLGSVLLLTLTGMVYVQLSPLVTVDPGPAVGRTVTVTIEDMPATGSWTVSIAYSDGTTEPPVQFDDSEGGQVTSTPPAGAGGGTMVVTVTSGSNVSRKSFDVSP
ncbi:MAG: hypothetical protein ACF8XB_05025 [Planctomycetota bacterium JB042]